MPKIITIGSDYHPREELANVLIHGIGSAFSVVALVMMLIKASGSTLALSTMQMAGVALYGVSLVLMFLSSTLYHAFSNTTAKFALKRLDHCAIFVLIAGTYTPILLISLHTTNALYLFWIMWAIAVLGILFKLLFLNRFKRFSLIAYLAMGWLAVFIIKDMTIALSKPAMNLMIAGGILYTVGAFFYAAKQYRYTHAIWHGFVLAAAICHALAIWLYVI